MLMDYSQIWQILKKSQIVHITSREWAQCQDFGILWLERLGQLTLTLKGNNCWLSYADSPDQPAQSDLRAKLSAYKSMNPDLTDKHSVALRSDCTDRLAL